jgi:hypothetical protein
VTIDTDPALLQADQAIRVLLLPSFSVEVCLTWVRKDGRASISVVSAPPPSWVVPERRRPEPSQEHVDISTEKLSQLFESLVAAARSFRPCWRGLDGMSAEVVALRRGAKEIHLGGKSHEPKPFERFLAESIALTWERLRNPWCRSAVGAAGRYVGLELRESQEPADTRLKAWMRVLRVGPK